MPREQDIYQQSSPLFILPLTPLAATSLRARGLGLGACRGRSSSNRLDRLVQKLKVLSRGVGARRVLRWLRVLVVADNLVSQPVAFRCLKGLFREGLAGDEGVEP
jgi:hypothetical protein